MTIPNRASPLMAKVLAACGDGEWRTVNAIAERDAQRKSYFRFVRCPFSSMQKCDGGARSK
jgi:hypothetical protein